jgi:hypothetical protein
MIGSERRVPPSSSQTLCPRALPTTSHTAQSTQAIASSSSLRARWVWLSANIAAQIRSPSKMLRPVTRGARASPMSRTRSGPSARLSPL